MMMFHLFGLKICAPFMSWSSLLPQRFHISLMACDMTVKSWTLYFSAFCIGWVC